jgi:hypothetical protein
VGRDEWFQAQILGCQKREKKSTARFVLSTFHLAPRNNRRLPVNRRQQVANS